MARAHTRAPTDTYTFIDGCMADDRSHLPLRWICIYLTTHAASCGFLNRAFMGDGEQLPGMQAIQTLSPVGANSRAPRDLLDSHCFKFIDSDQAILLLLLPAACCVAACQRNR